MRVTQHAGLLTRARDPAQRAMQSFKYLIVLFVSELPSRTRPIVRVHHFQGCVVEEVMS